MLKKPHLLIVDDDKRIRELLSKYLRENNYIVSIAKDAAEAKNILQNFTFDLLLIDFMMPEENGISLTKYVKDTYNTSVLMVTALNEIENRLEGLESGAEDYLAKPFDPRELLIRIRKIIERNSSKENILNLGSLHYDFDSKKLTKSNLLVELTESELKLFHLLATSFPHIVTREKVAQSLRISERSVDVQIIRLRNKIEDNPKKPYYLATVRNLGYKLN
jgi:two-component system phosphate regulon response regulator OmpR